MALVERFDILRLNRLSYDAFRVVVGHYQGSLLLALLFEELLRLHDSLGLSYG